MAQVNREQWLMKAVEHIVPIFERAGYAVPVVNAWGRRGICLTKDLFTRQFCVISFVKNHK
jgi:hypothetical protein